MIWFDRLIANKQKVRDATIFIYRLNQEKIPREMRESLLAKSGFNKSQLEIAMDNVKKGKIPGESPLDKVQEWIIKALENGLSINEAKMTLIQHGWKEKLVNKAIKIINKKEKQNGINRNKPTSPRFPTTTGNYSGDGDGNGNGQVELKRIFPVSSVESTPRVEQKLGRDWASFKRNAK